MIKPYIYNTNTWIKVYIYHSVSALLVCIIPCFAGSRGFSWLPALHTWELVTGNDHWPHLRIPGVLLYSHCRSEQTISAQTGSPPTAETIPTHIHPSPFGCRQRLRKALFSQNTHPRWGGIARSLSQGTLAATGRARRRHKHPVPSRDGQQTPGVEQAECHDPFSSAHSNTGGI